MISGRAATASSSPVYNTSPGFRISQDMIGKDIVRVQEQSSHFIGYLRDTRQFFTHQII